MTNQKVPKSSSPTNPNWDINQQTVNDRSKQKMKALTDGDTWVCTIGLMGAQEEIAEYHITWNRP